MKTVSKKAFAKLNLTLEVGEKREDGYHTITSVMTRATLHDTVEVSVADDVRLSSSLSLLNTPDNLCTRAANGYFEKTGIKGGAHIRLEKRIPVASGLGGGSADAAAVIECLEELYQPLEKEVRDSLALSLGADVPYCFHTAPCLCTGIGEICEEIRALPFDALYLNIIKVGEKLSTGRVYSELDALCREKKKRSHQSVVSALEKANLPLMLDSIFNDFEEVVLPSSPEVLELRQKLLSSGAKAVLMSGAGPALVAFFDDEKKARENGEIYNLIT